MEFYKLSGKFDDVLKYMLDDKLDIEKFYGPLRDLEMSQKYAITSALVYHVWRAKDKDEQEKRVNGFFRILEKLSSEFASMGCLGAMQGTDVISSGDACDILNDTEGYRKFILKHRDHIHKKVNVTVDLDE